MGSLCSTGVYLKYLVLTISASTRSPPEITTGLIISPLKNNGFSSNPFGVRAGAIDNAKLPSKSVDAVLNSLINIPLNKNHASFPFNILPLPAFLQNK